MAQEVETIESSFLAQLYAQGLLIPSSVRGVYGRSGLFEDIVSRLEDLITATGRTPETEVMRFPPVMSRQATVQSGYLRSFPQLLGVVHSFNGKHRQHSELLQDVENKQDWGHHLSSTELVLTPAACYPIYEFLADSTLPEDGRRFDVSSYIFRNEPSLEPARMQAFRMREYVRVADPLTVQAWHQQWKQDGASFLRTIGLNPILAPANDPFFGPGGRFLAASQQEQDLKYELLAPVNTDQPTTAIVSVNYHQEHFGEEFHIRTSDGQLAHTACIGFGLERITLALFRAHGFDIAQWPSDVQKRLWSKTI